jgi:hypothetical protein
VAHSQRRIRDTHLSSNHPEHECVEFALSDFAVSCLKDPKTGDLDSRGEMEPEMCTLLATRTNQRTNRLFFDGTISCGPKSRYLKNIPFGIVSIEGYGDAGCGSVSDAIFL